MAPGDLMNTCLGWILCGLLWISPLISAECHTVFTEDAQCWTEGDITLQCPSDHVVEINMAAAKKPDRSGCRTGRSALADACILEGGLTSYINGPQVCNSQQTCIIPTTIWQDLSLTRCASYPGDNVLTYSYRCIPVAVPVLRICDDVYLTGSSVRLTSSSMMGNIDCCCTIHKPGNIELMIERAQFTTANSSCVQRVVIYDDADDTDQEETVMCATLPSDRTVTWDCPDNRQDDQIIHICYEPDDNDPGAEVEFQINLNVPHDKTFTMECERFDHTTTKETTTGRTTTRQATTRQATTRQATTWQTTTRPTITSGTTTRPTNSGTTTRPTSTRQATTWRTTTRQTTTGQTTTRPKTTSGTTTRPTTSEATSRPPINELPNTVRSSSNLSTGSMASITAGAVAAFLVITVIVVAVAVCSHKKKENAESQSEQVYDEPDEGTLDGTLDDMEKNY